MIAYASLFLWVVVILILGSGPGASAQTSRIIKPLIEFFFPDASPDTFLVVHAFIRKAAHFIEYAVLALLAARASLTAPIAKIQAKWFLFSLSIALIVAAIDEFNQSFYSTRTGTGWDVLLDLSGAVFALSVLAGIKRRRSHN